MRLIGKSALILFLVAIFSLARPDAAAADAFTLDPSTYSSIEMTVLDTSSLPPCTGFYASMCGTGPSFVMGGSAYGNTSNGQTYFIDLSVGGQMLFLPPGSYYDATTWSWYNGSSTYDGYGYFQGGGVNTPMDSPIFAWQPVAEGPFLMDFEYSPSLGVTSYMVVDLNVDPITLSNLQPGQTVNFTVSGGCTSTTLSCSSTSPSQVPEPPSVALLATGLASLGIVIAWEERRRHKAVRTSITGV